MNSEGPPLPDAASGVDPLWDELARDQRDMGAIGPVLRYLVMGDRNELFGEEPVVRTRAMLASLALELLRQSGDNPPLDQVEALAAVLADEPALLSHVHAHALEGQLVARLADGGVDPLLPPLVQDRISATDPQIAALAMSLLAAQTRFVRRHQRMEMTASELPADLLHLALARLTAGAGRAGAAAGTRLRASFDERRGRLGIMTQLGLGLGDDFAAALDPRCAGFSLFATALSLVTGHDRDGVVTAAASARPLRLILLLAAAGIAPPAQEATLLLLHPQAVAPARWFALDPHHATALLAQGSGA